MDNDDERVVIHFDLDAFYVACERELNADLRNVPLGVSQYNPYGDLETRDASDTAARLVRQPNQKVHPQDANGSLIAVSYEARAAGVKRSDRGCQAAQKCPELHVVQVPVKHGKADLTMYRSASKRVMNILSKSIEEESKQFGVSKVVMEVASIDEVYFDVTAVVQHVAINIETHWDECVREASACTTVGGVETLSDAAEAANALDKDAVRRGSRLQVLDTKQDSGSMAWWNRDFEKWTPTEVNIACGAWIASRARAAVVKHFDGVFTLSAGVSSNKTLAKLASGLKKPNRQTLIYRGEGDALETLFHPLPLGRIRGLGGKFGEEVSQKFNVTTVGQLSQVPLTTLQASLETKTAHFLFDIARGICREPVTPRTKPKSIASSKTFRGRLSIASNDQETLHKWVGELCGELQERVKVDNEEHNRMATTLVVSVGADGSYKSKQCRAPRSLNGYYDAALQMILQLVEAAKTKTQATSVLVTGLSFSATQFVDLAAGSSSIVGAFERSAAVAAATPEGQSSSTPRSAVVHNKLVKPRSSLTIKEAFEKGGKHEGTTPTEQGATKPSKRPRSTKKSFAMDKWLVDAKNVGIKRPSMVENSTRSAKKRKESNPEVVLPTMDEIDPAVLRELPEDLRISLMKDIGRVHPSTKRKPNGIEQFFRPSRN